MNLHPLNLGGMGLQGNLGGMGLQGRLAIIAFGAFGFIVHKYFYSLRKMDKRSLDSLI